LIEGYG
jgi:hypothetical protein